jgi:hypothetical protein
MKVCVACNGSGYYDNIGKNGKSVKCESCEGSGKERLEFKEQVLEFKITDESLIMKMSLESLEFLFNASPDNFNGKSQLAKIKDGKHQEFAEFVVRFLMDYKDADSSNVNWSVPFERAFQEILEGAEDEIVDYFNY